MLCPLQQDTDDTSHKPTATGPAFATSAELPAVIPFLYQSLSIESLGSTIMGQAQWISQGLVGTGRCEKDP